MIHFFSCAYVYNESDLIKDGSTTSYTYDAENRMTAVSGAAAATFIYDGDGNRVKGVVGGVTTTYIGNYFEWTGSTSTMKKYYYAGGTRVAERKSTTLYWLLSDHVGSTSITATSSGSKTAELRYKPWGETRYTYGTTQTTIRYTGQREESSLGLYWYNSRWYSASLGRFVSPDSIIPQPGNPQAWDRYSYVYSNPVRYTDPNGHMVPEDGGTNYRHNHRYSDPGPIYQNDPGGHISLQDALLNPLVPTFSFPSKSQSYMSESLSPFSDYEIVGYRLEINWDGVDWIDVSISGAGIIGDVALATTPATIVGGAGVYGVSELVEFIGAVGNIKMAYDFFTKRDISGFVFEAGKGGAKIIGLAPSIGSAFDLLSIGFEIGRNAYFVPVYQKKEAPIFLPPPPL